MERSVPPRLCIYCTFKVLKRNQRVFEREKKEDFRFFTGQYIEFLYYFKKATFGHGPYVHFSVKLLYLFYRPFFWFSHEYQALDYYRIYSLNIINNIQMFFFSRQTEFIRNCVLKILLKRKP